MQLDQLKIIVTGAAQGMGAHFARRLAEAGAKVGAGDLNEALLSELPPQIHKRKLDVTSTKDRKDFVAWAAEKMGGLNALVSNAGIIRDGLMVRKDKTTGAIVSMMTDEAWDQVIAVNLTGASLMARDVAVKMAELGERGVIIGMSSVSRHGNRGQSNYVSAKAALAANTVTWARELAPFGIRAVAVAPGMIETPMTRGMNQKARDALVGAIPVGRIGEPEDIWLAVKFALECEYFNGRCLDVDGGLQM